MSIYFDVPFPTPICGHSFKQFLSNDDTRADHAVYPIENDRADTRDPLGEIYTLTVYQTVATRSTPINRRDHADTTGNYDDTRRATTPLELGVT